MEQISMSGFSLIRRGLVVLILGIVGCRPMCQVQLENRRTGPILFSVVPTNFGITDLPAHRIGGEDTTKAQLYQLMPHESLRIFKIFSGKLTTANLLIDTLRIYAGKDVFTFDNKQDILNRLVEKRKRDYYLIVQ